MPGLLIGLVDLQYRYFFRRSFINNIWNDFVVDEGLLDRSLAKDDRTENQEERCYKL